MTNDERRAYLRTLDEDALWNTLCSNTPGGMDASIMSTAEMIEYGVNNWDGVKHSMTEQQLREKMDEYVSTLDDTKDNEWYCTEHDLVRRCVADFWEWLDHKTYVHSNMGVYTDYTNRNDADALPVLVAEFVSSVDAADYCAQRNGVK